MADWRIIEGDCRDVLASLPEQSAHTCVTSPPYFGLRDYGHDGQIGLEPTPDEFVAALVDVFRGVRRVLRDDGTVWLNLGDSYASGEVGRVDGGRSADGSGNFQMVQRPRAERRIKQRTGTKPKDLLGIPWLVAFALRADGWYLRSDIIWSKPNPMPESVTDRPTKAHEYVFLLSKGPRYFYDADAIRDDAAPATLADKRMGTERVADFDTAAANFGEGTSASRRCARNAVGDPTAGRNKRSVWTVATQPYAGAHFATFPSKLVEPMILAGAPERACGECGAPWVRVVERTIGGPNRSTPLVPSVSENGEGRHGRDSATFGQTIETRTLGFEPSCSHGDGSASGVVLDPFAGAGTTLVVAAHHRRDSIGIELSSDYAQMARERIRAALDPHGTVAEWLGQGDLFGDAA